jgi:glutathione S-transferase
MMLHDAAWAPSPRKVRMFLAEKGIDVPVRPVDLRAGEQLSDAYLAINPTGAVPALQFDDGEVLTEAVAICRYFEALHPAPALFGTDPRSIARIESWTRRIEQEGYAAGVYAFRNGNPAFADRPLSGAWPPMPQIPALAERAAVMWDCFIRLLDDRLSTSTWVAGQAFSYADIAAFATVAFARPARLPVPDSATNLHRWLALVGARPSASA